MTRSLRAPVLLATAVSLLTVGANCSSAEVVIDHTDRGAFNVSNALTGDWKVTGGSYQVRAVLGAAVGLPDPSAVVTRAYFVFSLSDLAATTVTGAELRIFAPGGDGVTAFPSYDSSGLSETIEFFDVVTPSTELLAGNGATSPASIFPDLGDGTSYGTLTMTPADNGTFVSAVLDADAVAAIQSVVGVGDFVLGADLLTNDGTFSGINERVFRATSFSSPATQLVLTTIPEPSGLCLVSCVIVVGGFLQRRQRNSFKKENDR